jgi:hypothetical protein
LDGYVLAPAATPPERIPGAKGKDWDDLEREYPLLRQEGSYIERLFATPAVKAMSKFIKAGGACKRLALRLA